MRKNMDYGIKVSKNGEEVLFVKRFFMLFLCVILLTAMPFPASARGADVQDSIDEYYDHEDTGVTIPYRLIVPETYTPKSKFPLVVFFHGAGERGFENRNQLNNCVQQIADNMPKAIILVPQCAHENQWVDTPWSEGSYSVDHVPESDELCAVMDLLAEIMQSYSVDKDKVYAAGISMGGYAVWDVMVRHNDVFAAGVAVCGGGDPSKAGVLKDTPMFVFHGNQDETVPVTGSTDMVEAIRAAGGTKVQYTEYPGDGHGIWDKVFNLESLYKDLKNCKLSDRYVPEPEATVPSQPGQTPIMRLLPYLIFGGIGLLVVIFVTVLLIGKKKKV